MRTANKKLENIYGLLNNNKKEQNGKKSNKAFPFLKTSNFQLTLKNTYQLRIKNYVSKVNLFFRGTK